MSVRNIIVVLLMGSALLFTGCGNSREQYVDLESIETEPRVDVPEVISGYDATPYYDVFIYASYNERYIYGELFPSIVDMSKNKYSFLCSRVGCDHFHDDECELNQRRSCIRYYDGGLLYIIEDSLYYRSSYGKIKKLHTNTYSTEFSKKNYPVTKEEPWRPQGISGFVFLNENELLICAYNYVYVYDLQNKNAGEPIEICDSLVMGVCVNGDEIYSYNLNGEVYLTNLEDKTSKRILEQGRGIKLLDGRLWYAVWVDGAAQIHSNNPELTDERVEVENGDVNFVPCDGGVLYENDGKGAEAIMLRTFNGEDIELLNIEELTYAAGKAGYEYERTGIDAKVYTGGKLYVRCLWNGYGESTYEHDEAIVWYCVDNGKITELTGECK